mmetsp:Transcript_130801/g.419509  ORF Transcript_130801/g.419509 Transcript_130801/m.419509 type:complete len:234 (-) Transcript_130801:2006-2707(-)
MVLPPLGEARAEVCRGEEQAATEFFLDVPLHDARCGHGSHLVLHGLSEPVGKFDLRSAGVSAQGCRPRRRAGPSECRGRRLQPRGRQHARVPRRRTHRNTEISQVGVRHWRAHRESQASQANVAGSVRVGGQRGGLLAKQAARGSHLLARCCDDDLKREPRNEVCLASIARKEQPSDHHSRSRPGDLVRRLCAATTRGDSLTASLLDLGSLGGGFGEHASEVDLRVPQKPDES